MLDMLALYMAWRGVQDDNRLFWSKFLGQTWSPQTVVPNVGSLVEPTLAGFQDKLFMAWRGIEDGQQLYYSSFDGDNWQPQVIVPNTGSGAPLDASAYTQFSRPVADTQERKRCSNEE